MATSEDELEELHEETQEQDTQEQDTQVLSSDDEIELVGMEDEIAETAEAGPPAKKRKIRSEPTILKREPGKSLLPFSRVQKIIKADKEIPVVARDAVFLVSLATEEFIKRFCEAAQKVAEREKRTTVQHRDVATVIRKADEFLFLDELIPWMAPDPAPKRQMGKSREGKEGTRVAPNTMLDQYVMSGKG